MNSVIVLAAERLARSFRYVNVQDSLNDNIRAELHRVYSKSCRDDDQSLGITVAEWLSGKENAAERLKTLPLSLIELEAMILDHARTLHNRRRSSFFRTVLSYGGWVLLVIVLMYLLNGIPPFGYFFSK